LGEVVGVREVDSRRRSAASPRRRSQHGSLRETLVKVGRELIRSEGLDAVSLRAAATAAGVSAAAPYRHFANKDALLAAILVDGLEDLRDLLAAPVDGGTEVERLGTLGHRFVDFCTTEPDLLRLLAVADVVCSSGPELGAVRRWILECFAGPPDIAEGATEGNNALRGRALLAIQGKLQGLAALMSGRHVTDVEAYALAEVLLRPSSAARP
jgi:AcrR family transcriptional regulator